MIKNMGNEDSIKDKNSYALFRFSVSLLLGLLKLDGVKTGSLLRQSGELPLSHSLVLDSSSLHLLSQVLGSVLLGLGSVDVLHENSLVLEGVSLSLEVERVVEVLVDLASFSVLLQQSSENSHSSEPLDLAGHSSLSRTLSLTCRLKKGIGIE